MKMVSEGVVDVAAWNKPPRLIEAWLLLSCIAHLAAVICGTSQNFRSASLPVAAVALSMQILGVGGIAYRNVSWPIVKYLATNVMPIQAMLFCVVLYVVAVTFPGPDPFWEPWLANFFIFTFFLLGFTMSLLMDCFHTISKYTLLLQETYVALCLILALVQSLFKEQDIRLARIGSLDVHKSDVYRHCVFNIGLICLGNFRCD